MARRFYASIAEDLDAGARSTKELKLPESAEIMGVAIFESRPSLRLHDLGRVDANDARVRGFDWLSADSVLAELRRA